MPVYREWSGMSLPMHILALNGPLLLTFNSAALAKVRRRPAKIGTRPREMTRDGARLPERRQSRPVTPPSP